MWGFTSALTVQKNKSMCSRQEVRDEINKLYLKMSKVVHQTSPETDKRLTKLERSFSKIETAVGDLTKAVEENTKETKKVEPVLTAWTTLLNTKKGIVFFSIMLGGITVIITSLYHIKEWFKK